MASDFDNFPIYDPLTNKGQHLSPEWMSFLSTFIETLKEYLTQYGMFPSPLTTVQRDSSAVSPSRGQFIYNTTTNTLQYYNGTAWVSL